MAVPLLVIVGAIVWLRVPGSSSERRTARSDEPLDSDLDARQEGSPAPSIEPATVDGNDVSLSDYLDTLVVLIFWASWCEPCREEMPLFEQAQQRDGADNLVVLSICVREGVGTSRPLADRLGLTYPIVLDERGSVAHQFRVRSFPTTCFIGRDGTVMARRAGAYSERILFGPLDQLLNAP